MANIRKRGNTYQIRVSCGYKLNGEQVVQTMSWKPPEGMTAKQAEKEVQKQAILFEEKCLRGQVTANVKFEEFAEQWFEEYARLNLRKSSFERMRQVTQRVYPAFGHLRLDRITGRQIQQFINELVLNGKNMQTGKPLSRKTALHHLSFISDVFSYAVRMDIVSDNPCRKVYVPKGGKKEKEIYSIEEIEQLFSLLEDAPLKYRTFFTLAVYTGFRRGELMDLEWKDIDFESGVVSVRRTSNYTVKTGIYTDTTKTKSSQRSMKLPQLVLDILKEHKAEQDEERRKLGTKWFECDRLFVTADGHPMHNNTTYHWFEKFCKRNDFPFRDIHSLRHFYASALINEGIDVATVSSALGHSAISTTTSIYLHAFQDANARASEAIANVLDFSKKETPPPDPDGREKKIRLTRTSYGKSAPGKKAFSG